MGRRGTGWGGPPAVGADEEDGWQRRWFPWSSSAHPGEQWGGGWAEHMGAALTLLPTRVCLPTGWGRYDEPTLQVWKLRPSQVRGLSHSQTAEQTPRGPHAAPHPWVPQSQSQPHRLASPDHSLKQLPEAAGRNKSVYFCQPFLLPDGACEVSVGRRG